MSHGKTKLKKPTARQVQRWILNGLIIALGNALAAASSAFFIIPNGFVMGGTTGIGIFMRNIMPESLAWREWVISVTVTVANILLFIVGALLLDRKFALGTLAGTLLYPAFITLFTWLNQLYVDANGAPIGMDGPLGDPLMAAVLGAFFFGLGIGMVVRVGASTGGTDIPPLIFQKYFGTPVSISLWAVDCCILVLQFFGHIGLSEVFYGFFITVLTSVVIDKISPIGMRRTQVKIVSTKYDEIREMILSKISRGVTVLYGETGYLQAECRMILTVISQRELVILKREVQRIDPDAFITISVISEVRGHGFHSEGVEFLIPDKDDEPYLAPAERSTRPKQKEEPPHAEN